MIIPRKMYFLKISALGTLPQVTILPRVKIIKNKFYMLQRLSTIKLSRWV